MRAEREKREPLATETDPLPTGRLHGDGIEEPRLRVRRRAASRRGARVTSAARSGREARVTSEGSGESGRIGRLIYQTPRRSNGSCPASAIRRLRAVPAPCRSLERAVPGPALRADMAAQARHYDRVVPGTGMMGSGPGRTWAVLLSAMPGPAHRAFAIWLSIAGGIWWGSADTP